MIPWFRLCVYNHSSKLLNVVKYKPVSVDLSVFIVTLESRRDIHIQGRRLILSDFTTYQLNTVRSTHKLLTWPTPEFLPFTWSRREKPDHTNAKLTGDLDQSLPSYDLSTPKLGFEMSEELKIADENVKKIFTLATASQAEINDLIRENMTKQFKRHALDDKSQEAQIAALTVKTRVLVRHLKKHPRDKVAKVCLIHSYQGRNKYLRQLRQGDYRRFEWILQELKLVYVFPKDGKQEKITRKGEIRRLTREYCDSIKNEKLKRYHEKLKDQQESFLREKEDTLKWIEEEEQKLGIIESQN